MQIGQGSFGLKQTPRAQYNEIDKHLQDNDDVVIFVLSDICDIIITGSEVGAITKVKSELCSTFVMTDLSMLQLPR